MILSRLSPLAALACSTLVLLGACSALPQVTPYRIEIQQGNWVTQDMVAKLKPGMTKDQVRFVLGTPLVVDPFHTDRWDYVFARSPENSTQFEQRRITAYFADGKLSRIDGDVVAATKPAEGGSQSPAPSAQKPEAGGK